MSTAIFLFRRDAGRVRVVNEGMCLDATEVVRFARHMFAIDPLTDVVEFHAVQTESRQIPLLCQQAFCAEDFIVTLPSTPQQYLARLGPSTRKNLKFHHVALYRSPGALVRHACTALQTAVKGCALMANRWVLHHAATHRSLPWRMAGQFLATWRAAKNLRSR